MNTLKNTYTTFKKEILSVPRKLTSEQLNGPLLMSPSKYYEQKTKLLIIGQETKGWSREHENFESLFYTYESFNVGQDYVKKSSPFWNITRKIECLLGIDEYSCAWSNLNRYDHNGGEPKGHVLMEIENLDFLIKEEIKSIRPDVCFFFTNRKYDYRLCRLYKGVKLAEIGGLPFNHFTEVIHSELPKNTFRTPHPRTIRTRKWEKAFFTFLENRLK